MDDSEPLISRAAIALLALVLLGASVNKPASAKEVPKLPNPTQTATASPMPTNSPTPTETPAPTPTITQTPTIEPAIWITAQYKVKRCLRFRGIVESWIDLEPKEFNNLTREHVALVLAVGAAESGCDQKLMSEDGYSSIGIMQVIPRPWTASASMLRETRVNIYWGMYILDRSIDLADGDIRLGLAFFNCSYDKVLADQCGAKGGLNHSDNILEFWLPLFIEALEE